jgi:hypothetical protein
VECDLVGVFPPHASWRAISSGHAGCEGAQWVGDTLHYAAHHDGFAFKWSEATGLVVWRKDSPEGVLGSADFGLLRVTNRDPDVRALIEPYILAGA